MSRPGRPSSAARLAVIGSINADVSFFTSAFPAPHETVLAQKGLLSAGGKGLNQAVAAARAGAQVHLIGCVGEDAFGHHACAYARATGVDCTAVASCAGATTGMAGIFVNGHGDNMIAVAPGANGQLSVAQMHSNAALIARADMVVAQLEVPAKAVAAGFALARRAGVRTLLNPAPAIAAAKELIALADIITPNESETQSLTGIFPEDEASALQAAQRLHDLGARTVLITLGEQGCYLYEDRRGQMLPAFAVRAIDPTGAGDVFTGVLAERLGAGLALMEAARSASAAAALSVQCAGAEGAAPNRAQIAQFLAQVP